MKILITGCSGFVASYLAKECLKNGDEVIGTIRWAEDLSRMEDFKNKIKVENVELTDLSSILRAIGKHKPDVISHLAAQSWVTSSFDTPIWTMEANTIGTLNILEAVRIIKELIDPNYNPLIHIVSSSEVYGKVERDKLPITEEHKFNPSNPYGVSKMALDSLSQIYASYYDLKILITRQFTHTGSGRTMMSAENYYAKAIAEIEKGAEPIIRTGNMESVRTWADVKDAVKNYYNLFKNQKTGIYNISGETQKSIQEVLDYLISISTYKGLITTIPDASLMRKVDVDKQVVDISKFKKDCEWSNEISFEELMQSLLDYWRQKV